MYYRIVQRTHTKSPFGYGMTAGRWNQRNVPMIYSSSSLALSMTEYLSIKGSQVLNTKWSLITYDVVGKIPELEKASLPLEWDSRPFPLTTQQFGTQWAQQQTSACLKVPSARLLISAYPREHNLLINPLHPRLAEIVRLHNVEDLHFHLNEWATGTK